VEVIVPFHNPMADTVAGGGFDVGEEVAPSPPPQAARTRQKKVTKAGTCSRSLSPLRGTLKPATDAEGKCLEESPRPCDRVIIKA
jgi:hypothetical protein